MLSGSTAVITQFSGNTSRRIARALQRRFGGCRSAMKVAGQACQVSPRTMENWWYARTLPRADDLISAMAACDELADEVARMVAERKAILGK